ncbi:MAG: site-specific DNA-methyltransferase [Anaerolineae bacterium]|nr:site-specific DNA-methyltransferase [Anaerolineae bacterium]
MPSKIHNTAAISLGLAYREKLISLLKGDLNFHDQPSNYASHNFHAFPAKFPPQLPRKFIEGLTEPGDIVLDPMMGSGTTVVEALLSGRKPIGFDIDPLAVRLSKVKTSKVDIEQIKGAGQRIIHQASLALNNREMLLGELATRFDNKTREFIDYWFAPPTQLELVALVIQIEKLTDLELRNFFSVILSSIIITKSGGVSLAFDLAHTRPHRAKVVLSQSGEIILGEDTARSDSRRVRLLTKTLHSPIEEFEKRLQRNLSGLIRYTPDMISPRIQFADAQQLPLDNETVDLIVTSPPYISNAIDYMRAHKFSLVWLGYPIQELGNKRKAYIGGEAVSDTTLLDLPSVVHQVVHSVGQLDRKKAQAVHRYYSEMTLVLKEMYRVLRPGKAAIVVVGTSVIREIDTQIDLCLAEIGKHIGFEIPAIGVRNLDRNRRMLPAGATIDGNSQIEQRMHEEFIIGFYKPISGQGNNDHK